MQFPCFTLQYHDLFPSCLLLVVVKHRNCNMEKTFKRNIQKLVIFMLIAAIIPLFGLLVPLLPHMISGIVFLLLIIGWVLFCFFILLLGSAVILELPCPKLFRRLILIAWFSFYTLLCWGWATLVMLVGMQIFGHVYIIRR